MAGPGWDSSQTRGRSGARYLRTPLLKDEIPAVAAITAAIGGDVTHVPDAVLGWLGNEVRSTTAVNTDDRGGRRFCAVRLAVD